MTPPTAIDDRLDRELRATLRRHAGDVDPQPPGWDELIGGPDPVVRPLRRGDGPETGRRRVRRRWARPAMAAAALLAVVVTAAVLADTSPDARTGPDGEGQFASPPPEPPLTSPVIPAPGDADFDPAAANAVYPVDHIQDPGRDAGADDYADRDDPRALATQYLAGRLGVAEPSLEVGQPAITPGPSGDVNVGATATVRWASRDGAGGGATAQGTVFLHEYPSSAGRVWAVAGATTDGLRLTDVRRDETRTSFMIDRREDPRGDPVAVSVTTGAGARPGVVPVPGGEQVSDRAWLVDVQPGGQLTVTVPVAGDGDVSIAVVHADGDRWLSITETSPTVRTAGEVCGTACADRDPDTE